jgi:hypothetical protein
MKTIHALTIIDKSSSMLGFKSRTIEGINSNINALKLEVDSDTKIINTQLQFSSTSGGWIGFRTATENAAKNKELDFVFSYVGKSVTEIAEMTANDYLPVGGTPMFDAVGYGIEKVKEFHKDDLGADGLKIIVTIFTDGEENSSTKWKKSEIKQMIEHFSSDGKWTFTFVGCGDIDSVEETSAGLGINAGNTVAYAATDAGYSEGFSKVATSYTNFARSAKLGTLDKSLFEEKAATVE